MRRSALSVTLAVLVLLTVTFSGNAAYAKGVNGYSKGTVLVVNMSDSALAKNYYETLFMRATGSTSGTPVIGLYNGAPVILDEDWDGTSDWVRVRTPNFEFIMSDGDAYFYSGYMPKNRLLVAGNQSTEKLRELSHWIGNYYNHDNKSFYALALGELPDHSRDLMVPEWGGVLLYDSIELTSGYRFNGNDGKFDAASIVLSGGTRIAPDHRIFNPIPKVTTAVQVAPIPQVNYAYHFTRKDLPAPWDNGFPAYAKPIYDNNDWEGVALRSSPTSKINNKIADVPTWSVVYVIDYTDGWLYVRWNDKAGYMDPARLLYMDRTRVKLN